MTLSVRLSEKLPSMMQLRCLVALSETLHFRKAAASLGITQPSFSVQIQSFETLIRARLAERSRSGVIMTPVGRELAVMAKSLLLGAQELLDAASQTTQGLAGIIRLGSPQTLGPYLLPEVVRRLHQDYPELRFYVREGVPRELQNELIHGDLDLILTPLPVHVGGVRTALLFREPLYLAMASDNPLAAHARIDAKHLKGARILTLGPQHHLHDQVRDLCDEYQAELMSDYEGTSLDTLRYMTGMGLGMCFLPALYVRSEIPARGEVIVRPFAPKKIFRTVGIAWREKSKKMSAYSAIANIVRDLAYRKYSDLIPLSK